MEYAILEYAIFRIQDILICLSQVPYILLLLIVFSLTLIENIFPPAPSDVCFLAVTVFIGTNGQFIIPVILCAAIGATIGFWIMYLLGLKFETKIIEGNKIKFISRQSIEKAENMFQKWGIKLVAINRFMSGTRAIISFFAGMSALPKIKTMLYAGLSSLVYYGLLAYAGYYFGKDWKRLSEFLKLYQKATFFIVIAVITIALSIWIIKKIILKKKK
jgi:membrane protein DedA with SNARE-associated domain